MTQNELDQIHRKLRHVSAAEMTRAIQYVFGEDFSAGAHRGRRTIARQLPGLCVDVAYGSTWVEALVEARKKWRHIADAIYAFRGLTS